MDAPAAIVLVPLDHADLRRLAAAEPIGLGGMSIPEGALPPTKVAVRALAQLEQGTPAMWCVPLLIVDRARPSVLGGCRFKGAPANGTVEIGYGVASGERGRGVATAAVAELLRIATASGVVREVVAHILPDNAASSAVAAKLGFAQGRSVVDTDGETVMRWSKAVGMGDDPASVSAHTTHRHSAR